jgi:hypothetical protein
VLGAVAHPEAARIAPVAAIAAAAASLAANMRGLSLLWVAIAVLAPFVLAGGGRLRSLLGQRSVRIAVAVTIVAVALAATWLLGTNSLGAALDRPGPVTDAPAVGSSPASGFIWTLLATFTYSEGLVGVFGWLDTPAPEFVFFVWSLFVGALALVAVVVLRGRRLVLAGGLLLALLLLPPLVQAAYITQGGIIWQGRYILPVFVCAMVGLGAVIADRVDLSRASTGRLIAIVLALWGVAQVYSFATALRRYAVGLDSGWLGLLHPRWSPPGGIPLALAGFALVVGLTVVVATRALRRATPERAPASV